MIPISQLHDPNLINNIDKPHELALGGSHFAKLRQFYRIAQTYNNLF